VGQQVKEAQRGDPLARQKAADQELKGRKRKFTQKFSLLEKGGKARALAERSTARILAKRQFVTDTEVADDRYRVALDAANANYTAATRALARQWRKHKRHVESAGAELPDPDTIKELPLIPAVEQLPPGARKAAAAAARKARDDSLRAARVSARHGIRPAAARGASSAASGTDSASEWSAGDGNTTAAESSAYDESSMDEGEDENAEFSSARGRTCWRWRACCFQTSHRCRPSSY